MYLPLLVQIVVPHWASRCSIYIDIEWVGMILPTPTYCGMVSLVRAAV